MTALADELPPGFGPFVRRSSPWLASLGPLFRRADGVLGLRVTDAHVNFRGVAHGGMLVTFADSALGIALATDGHGLAGTGRGLAGTVSLSSDFLDAARPGDFLEAHVDVERRGGRLAFATCLLRAGERKILRASGVFSLSAPRPTPGNPEGGG